MRTHSVLEIWLWHISGCFFLNFPYLEHTNHTIEMFADVQNDKATNCLSPGCLYASAESQRKFSVTKIFET